MSGSEIETVYYVMGIAGGIVAGVYASVMGVVKATLFIQALRSNAKHAKTGQQVVAGAADQQQIDLREFEANIGRRLEEHIRQDDLRFENFDQVVETVGYIRESVARIEGHLGIFVPRNGNGGAQPPRKGT